MPTTQKSQQKQTKATQKVGGSAKKPVTKAMEGGKAAPSKGKTERGGKVATPMKTKTLKDGGMVLNYEETKKRSLRNEYLIKRLLAEFYKKIEITEPGEPGKPSKMIDLLTDEWDLKIFDKETLINPKGNLHVIFHEQDWYTYIQETAYPDDDNIVLSEKDVLKAREERRRRREETLLGH